MTRVYFDVLFLFSTKSQYFLVLVLYYNRIALSTIVNTLHLLLQYWHKDNIMDKLYVAANENLFFTTTFFFHLLGIRLHDNRKQKKKSMHILLVTTSVHQHNHGNGFLSLLPLVSNVKIAPLSIYISYQIQYYLLTGVVIWTIYAQCMRVISKYTILKIEFNSF